MIADISKQTKFILVIALQVFIIAMMIVFKLSIFTGGSEVILHIQPIDPQDPLRGDYVKLSYDISEIPFYYFNYSSIENGDEIYVPLRKSGKYFYFSGSIDKEKPQDGLFIKGIIKSGGEKVQDSIFPSDVFDSPQKIMPEEEIIFSVIYGIEDYFISEGAGRFENFLGDNNFAKVIIDENGNAILKQIFVNNEIWP